ncbi:hypothetical protein D8S78_24350 [Natrialba swarupiae]|nr:hypothetical protein [Natrialba swarupiae]
MSVGIVNDSQIRNGHVFDALRVDTSILTLVRVWPSPSTTTSSLEISRCFITENVIDVLV